MRKRRIWETPKVDHIGPGGTHCARTTQDGIDSERGGINDFRKYSNIMAGKIKVASAFSKIGGKVLQLIRPPLEWNAEFSAQTVQIRAASSGQQHAASVQCVRNAAPDDGFGHQRRDLNPDINNRPAKSWVIHAAEDFLQAWLGQMAGQEGNMFGHGSSCLRCESAPRSSSRFSTTTTSLHDFSRAVFSRSICRGKTLTMPFGASVSSSGAVSQAKTMENTRHLPACANTFVANVSEIP